MANKKKNWYYMGVVLAAVAILVLLDQWTKHLAVVYLKDQPSLVLIKGVLELEYLENRGAAFGLLQGQQWLFSILTLVFFGVALWFLWRMPKTHRFIPIYWILIILTAGAAGNFIDRIVNKYVVDFIYFVLIDFPVFNVADIYVSVSAVVLFILILFVYKESDYDEFFRKKVKI